MDKNSDFEFAGKKQENTSEELVVKKPWREKIKLVLVVISSFLLPMIGFALYLSWKEKRPLDAKYPGIATIVAVVFGYSILIYWIFFR